MPLNIIGFSILVMFITISFAYTRKENISKTLLVFLTIIILQIISIISSNLSIKFSNYEMVNFFPSFSVYPRYCFLFQGQRNYNAEK